MDRPLRWKRSVLFTRLLGSKTLDYNTKLKKRYHELRDQDIFSADNIREMRSKIDIQISSSLIENEKLWPMKSQWYYDDNNYQQEVEIIKKFIDLRLNQMDAEYLYDQ